MTAANLPEETWDAFVVVANDEGQHALWQAGLTVPPGWHRRSPVQSKNECLSAIEAAWQDLAPASARAAPGRGRGDRFVHELVAEQAARRPDALAVMAGRTRLTYRELDQSASQLAHYLGELGVGPETVTGVRLERGAGLIQVILAIMKAGGAYLPLDPALPAERLARICAHVRPAPVITADADVAAFAATGLPVLTTGAVDAVLARYPVTSPGLRPQPENLCYVIHTSGSTGDPKAVAVSFGSLAATIGEMTRAYEISEQDRVGQVAAMAFDTSLEQVFTALTGGATLVLPPPGTMAPSELLRGIGRKRITVIDLTPAYWHQVLAHAGPDDERLRSVRLMITGGAAADAEDCRAALRAAPWARLLNAYGLTETTITSTLGDVGAWVTAAGPQAVVPVGRPAGHARVMVLDEQLNPVPTETAGEIYIGGSGVARGYLGRPGLTAERFLPDISGAPGERMYRTGDLGRWLEDGTLEVTGRLDRQLKVRGFRVEPGEIERVLAGYPGIGQVSVVATPRRSGDTRLVAYYTPDSGTASQHPSAASLRRYLLDRLPAYMIPATFIARHHGAAQGARPVRAGGHDEQHTPTQAGLSALWARLLGRSQVRLDDDFFALGGNSLLAAEMLAHTRAIFGIAADAVRPLTRCLLRDPTLRGFAAAVADARAGQLSSDGDQAEVNFQREVRLNLKLPARQAAAGETGAGETGAGEARRTGGAAARNRSRPPEWRQPRDILLTGATGFLGAHLLSELLAATGARVHCLVRARDSAAARTRIRQAAERYELPAPTDDRVVPLAGDLAQPRLGLSSAVFRQLARDIDVIHHAGAMVNFIYPYQELRAANVAGTREIIRLAALERGIPVHYVSTTAVLAGLGVAGTRKVTEDTPLEHPELLRMGYVETKYVAEELLRAAGRAGLPVAVYRPLDIVGSINTGAWSTATEMAALIRFIADTGLAPDIDLPLDFVAADVCAAAIRHISVTEGTMGRTYHLASPQHAPLGVLTSRLRERGYHVDAIPYDDWVRELAKQAAQDPSHPMAAFLPLFVDRGPDGLTVAEMYLSHVFPAYSRAHTEHALLGSGIAFPPVDGELLDRNIDRLMQTGYLPPPPAQATGPAGPAGPVAAGPIAPAGPSSTAEPADPTGLSSASDPSGSAKHRSGHAD